jgi:hypothetical protein
MDQQMANMMGKMRIGDEHKGWIEEYDKIAHEERMPKEFEEFERIYQERPMHRPPMMNNNMMMHRPPQGWLEEYENREFDEIYEQGGELTFFIAYLGSTNSKPLHELCWHRITI